MNSSSKSSISQIWKESHSSFIPVQFLDIITICLPSGETEEPCIHPYLFSVSVSTLIADNSSSCKIAQSKSYGNPIYFPSEEKEIPFGFGE